MLNQDKNNLSKDIFNTLPLIFKEVKKIIKSLDIELAPNQIKILHLINHHSTTINELANKFDVSPPTMSETIDGLLEKKLVQKIKSTKDRRITKITLTDFGQKKITQTHKKIMTELDKKINTLSMKEKNILLEGMNILQKTFAINKNK